MTAHPKDVRVPTLLDRHPDTGALIDGFEFPGWSELCDTTRRAAEQFPELPTGGWDVAMTTTGPVVIETNWRYDIDLIQIANQRGARPDLMPLLRYALHARHGAAT